MASPFFGENKPNWTDMSDYVVHFAKDYEKKSAYDNMLSILGSQEPVRLDAGEGASPEIAARRVLQ